MPSRPMPQSELMISRSAGMCLSARRMWLAISSGPGDLKAIGEVIKEKKIVIGVIDHHTLQVERPDQVAALIREALKHIPAERLIISSDCGMGREGMSRRHAFYKMVALVQGVNVVKKELGLPVTESMAADPKFSLLRMAQ